jgi:regulator of replication initiation timing
MSRLEKSLKAQYQSQMESLETELMQEKERMQKMINENVGLSATIEHLRSDNHHKDKIVYKLERTIAMQE